MPVFYTNLLCYTRICCVIHEFAVRACHESRIHSRCTHTQKKDAPILASRCGIFRFVHWRDIFVCLCRSMCLPVSVYMSVCVRPMHKLPCRPTFRLMYTIPLRPCANIDMLNIQIQRSLAPCNIYIRITDIYRMAPTPAICGKAGATCPAALGQFTISFA